MRVRTLAILALVVGAIGCAQLAEADKSRADANRTGKHAVTLTEDPESVQGRCTFLRTIIPDWDPLKAPTNAEADDYFRVEGVLMGADTVLVNGRTGEAYICKNALNPDGTPRAGYAPAPPN